MVDLTVVLVRQYQQFCGLSCNVVDERKLPFFFVRRNERVVVVDFSSWVLVHRR